MGAIVRKDAVEESLKRGLKVELRLLVASEELIRVYRLGRSRSRRIHREKNGRSKNKNARGTGCADCGKVNSERKSSQKSKQHHARIPPHPGRIYALFPAYLLINKNGLAFFLHKRTYLALAKLARAWPKAYEAYVTLTSRLRLGLHALLIDV